jgi:hypothetical protein
MWGCGARHRVKVVVDGLGQQIEERKGYHRRLGRGCMAVPGNQVLRKPNLLLVVFLARIQAIYSTSSTMKPANGDLP